MSQRKEPHIVLVPGMSCVGTIIFEPLITTLHALGLQHTHAIDIPSVIVDSNSTTTTTTTTTTTVPTTTPSGQAHTNALEADIAAVRKLLVHLIVDEGQDVLVVAHSYGGVPALPACEGLWKRERTGQAAGKKRGGVVKVALIAAPLILPGTSVNSNMAEYGETFGEIKFPPPKIEVTDAGMTLFPLEIIPIFFPDLPNSEAQHWESTLRPHLIEALSSPVPVPSSSSSTSTTTTPVQKWDIAYLLTTSEHERALPRAYAEWLIEKARTQNKDGSAVSVDIQVDEIDTGHFPWLTRPTEVAEWLKGTLSS